jgi:DNA-binding NarL/FixJ family response regulator
MATTVDCLIHLQSMIERRPRVLLADDDAGIQTAVSRLLAPSCDVVGCVGDVSALFEAAARLRPDVVLLDFSLPGDVRGVELCRRLKTLAPEVKVVPFTGHDDEDTRRFAYEAGASGFVWKLRPEDLLRTIHAVMDGMPPHGPGGHGIA